MKTIVILTILACSIMSGPVFMHLKRYRIKYIKDSAESLRLISNEIAYKAISVPEIIENISKKYDLDYYKKISIKATDFYNYAFLWNKAINSDYYLDNESKIILFRVGDIIGKTNALRQYELLNKYADELNEIYIEKKEELKQKSKLYNSFGILFGLFLTVMFI